MTRLTSVSNPFLYNGCTYTIKDTLPAAAPYAAQMLCQFALSDGTPAMAIIARSPDGAQFEVIEESQTNVQNIWSKSAVDYLLNLSPIAWAMDKATDGPDGLQFKGKLPAKMIFEIRRAMEACAAQQWKNQRYTIHEVRDGSGASGQRAIQFKVSHGKGKRYCQLTFVSVSGRLESGPDSVSRWPTTG